MIFAQFPNETFTKKVLVYLSPLKKCKAFYISKFIKELRGGGNINLINSNKLELIRFEDDFYTHKQVELKNGLLFVRIKKRFHNKKFMALC